MFLKKYFLAYGVLAGLFLVGVVLASTIPSTLLKEQITASLPTLADEGQYPSYGITGRQIVLDNYTDALMLNTAYSVDAKHPFTSALLNARFGEPQNIDQVVNLGGVVDGKATQKSHYERYWHGYLLYLRPLLTVMSYDGVRVFLNIAIYLLSALFIFFSWKRLGFVAAAIYLIGLIAIDVQYLGQSMQFSSVVLVGLVGAIYMLRTYKKGSDMGILFFIVGAVTAYFDLLTAPLISLGLILVVAQRLERHTVRKLFMLCVAWSFGYLLLWASKWLIVEIFVAPGAMQTAFDQIVNRTVTTADADFSHLTAIQRNVFQLMGYHQTSKIVLAGFALILGIIVARYHKITKKTWSRVAPWLFLFLIPYAWYLIAANHSYLHVWYTYRNQFMSVVAGLFMVVECVDFKKLLPNPLPTHHTPPHGNYGK